MALKPALSFLRLGSITSPHILEVYLDTNCPFSAKIVKSLDENVIPLISDEGKLAGKMSFIIRLQPQPWHATSTYLHEAALAFGAVSPSNFWTYFKLLFVHQEDYFDRPASSLTSVQIRENLATLASQVLETSDEKTTFLDKLTFKSSPNGGVDVTDDLKYNVKLGRQNGIHVTPTALFDGLIEGSISSSWGKDDWEKFFKEKIVV
ncbi:hypothetical protein BDY24DRAFT_395350 [Mrakia frigida]|uniref:uncharacterized protein n=1 Tax=Mrakia frigida TaxID=29902 RepID=UPI003FCC0734